MNKDDAEGPLKNVKLMLSPYIQRLKLGKSLVSGELDFLFRIAGDSDAPLENTVLKRKYCVLVKCLAKYG